MRLQLLKQPTVRLHGEHYRELREGVLRRDGWRCQLCGSVTNLTVHHQQYRSHSGEDVEQNLITLCSECHSAAHRSSNRFMGSTGTSQSGTYQLGEFRLSRPQSNISQSDFRQVFRSSSLGRLVRPSFLKMGRSTRTRKAPHKVVRSA
jgi:phage terminase large subunit GpA-like protein